MAPPLPPKPNLRHLKYEAKALLKACKRGDPDACARLTVLHRFSDASPQEIAATDIPLREVQYALAMGYGFTNWRELKAHVDALTVDELQDGTTMTSRTETPQPFDQYPDWDHPRELDPFRKELVFSAFPKGSEIVDFATGTPYAEYPGQYDRARVRTPNGNERTALIMWSGRTGGIEVKVRALSALGRLGFPVPAVLADPVIHPDYPDAGPLVVLGALEPGGRYLPFVGASAEELDLTCRLLIEGVERLHAATGALLKDEASRSLPKRTLPSELRDLVRRGGPWFEEEVFTKAVERLRPVLDAVGTPLVFSNGYNYTWNLLCDGVKLTGFVGFDGACFEDPHIAFTTYPLWGFDPVGWAPFNRAGLVERWLYRHNVSRSEFAPRLALRCLWRLQREVPVEGDASEEYRSHILGLLRESLGCLP